MASSHECLILECLTALSTPCVNIPEASSSPNGSIQSPNDSFSSPGNNIELYCSSNYLRISPVPVYYLDYVRAIESLDFCTNGIEQDLDEYDLYQINQRETTCPANKNKRYRLSSCNSTRNHVYCVFCRNNGESLSIYGSHTLKDTYGRITCPVLRRYTCPICRSSGDEAHTIKYCPMNVNRIAAYRRR